MKIIKRGMIFFCSVFIIFIFLSVNSYSMSGSSSSGGGNGGGGEPPPFELTIPKMNIPDLITSLQNETITNETIRYIVESQLTQEVIDFLTGRYHYLNVDELNKLLERNNINTIRVKADGSTKYIEKRGTLPV